MQPLRPLHPESSLSRAKLDELSNIPTEQRLGSLEPGQIGCLKARPDGTVVDGHHRIKILRDRGIDVDSLPRELVDGEG
jgi:hypothetical protein